MPCTDPWAEEEDRREEKKRVEAQRQRLDNVTKLLCNVMQAFEECEVPGDPPHLPDEVWAWWEEHKAQDKKRRATAAKIAKETRQLEEKLRKERIRMLERELKELKKKRP